MFCDEFQTNIVHKDFKNETKKPSGVSELHNCALNWSEKCSHCEFGFDELKQRLLVNTTNLEESQNELQIKINECLTKAKGFN